MPNVKNGEKAKNRMKWLLAPAIIFFILSVFAALCSFAWNKIYSHRIYPNIFIGSLDVGNKTVEQAKNLINSEVNKISQTGVLFSYKNGATAVMPLIASAGADIAVQIAYFNVEQAVGQAFGYGRNRGTLTNLKEKLSLLAGKKQLFIPISINQPQAEKILQHAFAPIFLPAEDAKLAVQKKQPEGNYEFSVEKEKAGKIIDCEQAIDQMVKNLSALNNKEIKLATITQYPKIFSADALNIGAKAEKILSAAPLTLAYENKKWIIDKDALAGMLALEKNDSEFDKITVGLDEAKINVHLREQIAPQINRKPIEAKFQMSGGKVSEFQNGQDGIVLDTEETFSKIKHEIFNSNPIELAVNKLPVLSSAGDLNDFGIKEIIGIGSSNFAGSPANRRHNIKIGAAAVSGTLIKPGEEFSLLKILGEVSAAAGYLPELVIKENKTTPEFGGGLCQIGTTVFRATLESGLPVTMRRNHSYRVQYYEPAGTDATIYDPWPDYKFINDTPHHILIQAKFSGDNLSFEFWGTKDGRVVEKTKPIIYNIIKPEPTKIVETVELKPGEKKCVEKPHNGADAYFDYKISYADGQIEEKRFSSHYVPWREVCLLGVEKLSGTDNASATSTPPSSPFSEN